MLAMVDGLRVADAADAGQEPIGRQGWASSSNGLQWVCPRAVGRVHATSLILLGSLWFEGCGQHVNTSRMSICGVHVIEVEIETCSTRAKEARTLSPRIFASSRQSPRPRWSAFRDNEFEECKVLVWDSCWLNGCQFLVYVGGLDSVQWFGFRAG